MSAILGAGIRAVRERHGLFAYQLASQVGICGAHMCAVEIGTREPSMGLLSRIADALGVPAEDLASHAPEATYCQLVRNREIASDEDVFCTRCPERVPAGCQGVCVPAMEDFHLCPAELQEECPCCYPPTPDRMAAWENWSKRRARDDAAWMQHDSPVRERRWALADAQLRRGEYHGSNAQGGDRT